MPSFTRYKPPTKQKVLEQQLSEHLRRTRDACRKASEGTQEYVFNRTTDKREVEFSIYRQRYPDNWIRKLVTLCRVKLEPGMFVINEENDKDQDFKVREALVYTISEQVMSPKNPDTHILSYCTTKMGVFKKPRVVLEYDDLGNVIKSETIGWNNMFYIPWDNGNIARKVIDEFGGSYRNTVLAIAKKAGDEWHTGSTYSVFNLNEWLESDFDTLLGANKGGFLKSETGGTKLYLKDQEEKRKKMELEIKEYERRRKEGMTGDKTKN